MGLYISGFKSGIYAGQQERQAEQHDLINVPFERLQLADVEERTPFGLRNSLEHPKTTSGLCKSSPLSYPNPLTSLISEEHLLPVFQTTMCMFSGELKSSYSVPPGEQCTSRRVLPAK